MEGTVAFGKNTSIKLKIALTLNINDISLYSTVKRILKAYLFILYLEHENHEASNEKRRRDRKTNARQQSWTRCGWILYYYFLINNNRPESSILTWEASDKIRHLNLEHHRFNAKRADYRENHDQIQQEEQNVKLKFFNNKKILLLNVF